MRREVRVGLLFLVAAAAFAFMVTKLTQSRSRLGSTRPYYTLVDDASGLLEGSGVRVAGIIVGTLTKKSLKDGRARLDMDVSTSVAIHTDASVTLRTLGYLGDRYIDLNSGTQADPTLSPGAYLPATQGATMEDLMARGTEFLYAWTQVAQSLHHLIGD